MNPSSEPYRLFFPAGILAGIGGVLMWPLLYAGKIDFFPGEAHARVMIEGFMGAFVIGFLGTAFPRLTGSGGWTRWELGGFLALWLLAVSGAFTNRVAMADATFAAMLLLLFAGMARRWLRGNRDTPPPGFVLALAGVLGGALAAAALAWQGGSWMSVPAYRFAKLWLYQGFLLLPLLGISPFLLPRFYGQESTHSFDDSPSPPPGWWPKVAASATCGLFIAAGFALEAVGKSLPGHLLRAAAIFIWFLLETPVFRRGELRSTPGNVMRFAVAGLVLGTAAAGFWPLARVGSLHLFFAAGLGLAAIAVGTRVILGHAGRHDLLTGGIGWLRLAAGLLILAAATRVTSDFVPAVRVSHHIYAAWAWAAGCLLWLLALARHLGRDDTPKPPRRSCPRRLPSH